MLSLGNIITEKRVGLHSVLTILCGKCNTKTEVQTGKMNESNFAQVHLEAVLGKVSLIYKTFNLIKCVKCLVTNVYSITMFEVYSIALSVI